MVLEGYRRCPDSHDLSECHHLCDLGRHIYTHNSVNFDSEKISVETLWDHLKVTLQVCCKIKAEVLSTTFYGGISPYFVVCAFVDILWLQR